MAKNYSSKNIIITSSNFPKGSACANYLNLFCKGIVLSGLSAEVFILKGYFLQGQKIDDAKKNFTDYGVNYSYLGFTNRSSKKILKIIGDIYGTFSLARLLLSFFKNRKDITIFTYNNEFYHSLLINCYCKLIGIKIISFVPEYYDISEFSGNLFHRLRWYSFLLNFNYINRLSDKLIVFSQYIKDKYIEKKYPESKILIQPNLTDFDFWYKNDSEIIFTVGYSGTPYKKDGIEDLLTAISILRKKDVAVNVVIIGDVVNEKSIIPSLRGLCENLGIGNLVTFTGHVTLEEVRDWLNKCNILAITRPNIVQAVAGFPTKIGEYFACKKTVLSTKIGDVSHYFRNKDEIVFADSDNPQSIADNIEWIINNQETSKKIALNGHLKAKELLNYKNKVLQMIEFANQN